MNNFTLEILVPSGKVLSQEVQSVSLPGVDGEIGVLPDHANYTGILGTGVLEYRDGSGKASGMVISGGIVQFSDNTLKVLADAVETKESIDRASYSEGRRDIENSLKEKDVTTPEWISSKAELDKIEAVELLLSKFDKNSLN